MKHEQSASGRASIAAAVLVASMAVTASARASDCVSAGAGAGGTCATLLAAQTTKAPFNLRVVQGDGGYCVVAYVTLQ